MTSLRFVLLISGIVESLSGNLDVKRMKLLQPADLKIDGSNAMPLYMQLANEIQRVIDEGQLRPGDALPSERTLMEALGISRGTTRKAIEQLIEDRSLIRNPGSGTYVAPHVRQSLVQLESFSEIAFASGGGTKRIGGLCSSSCD